MSLPPATPQPVLIVTAGSSTTAGQFLSPSDRWPNLLAADLQSAYPLDNGVPSPATTSYPTTPPIAPTKNGVQVINVANGGEDSDTYLTLSGTARNATAVGDLDPALVIHQPVSADFANQKDPATTKPTSRPASPRSTPPQRPRPSMSCCTHTAVGTTTARTYDEQDYVDVLNEIAAEDPDRIIVIDLRDEFAGVGIGYSSDRSDPLHMMYDSNVHLNATGNAYLEDLIWPRWASRPMAPAWPVPQQTPSPL